MHHKMQSGSIARAASALPISSVSHPNDLRMPDTFFLEFSSFPQMNMVGGPPLKPGLYIMALPTLLNAFTTFASGNHFWILSISESSSVVKYFKTPLSGGSFEI